MKREKSENKKEHLEILNIIAKIKKMCKELEDKVKKILQKVVQKDGISVRVLPEKQNLDIYIYIKKLAYVTHGG